MAAHVCWEGDTCVAGTRVMRRQEVTAHVFREGGWGTAVCVLREGTWG